MEMIWIDYLREWNKRCWEENGNGIEEMEELRRWNNTTVGLVGLNRMKRPTNWTSSSALEASTYATANFVI